MTVPIGFASNDGVGYSLAFLAGRWQLNPNHLLFEPLGAWWQSVVMARGYPREPFDALRLLSVLSGSIALGLFRLGIAPHIAAGRFEANHATAWMAIAGALVIRQFRRHRTADALSAATSIVAGLLISVTPPLLLAWSTANSRVTFFEWITRYGGGSLPARIRDAYGIDTGLSGLITASARALYGAACAMVDALQSRTDVLESSGITRTTSSISSSRHSR